MSLANISKKNMRWFWFGMLAAQTGLMTVLLLFSIRSIWSFINGVVDSATGLKEYSFLVVFVMLILLVLFSVSYLVYLLTLGKSKKKDFYKAIISLFFVELFIFIAILIQLYPNLESMYLSQLPYWLYKENVLIIGVVLSIGLTSFLFLKYRKRNDNMLNVFFVLNGVLFIGVLSFGYMAFTVRSFDFAKNSLQSAMKKSDTYFQIDTRNTERFPANDSRSIHPTISMKINMDKGGNYLTAGDLTGDGIVEIITARLWVEPMDINRVKSIAVQSLLTDSISGERGKTLWSWESEYEAPGNIGGGRGSSAAIAVFDLETGMENHKLLMATDGWLYEFMFDVNGKVSEKKVATGTVNSSDCLIIANLDGTGKHHLLLKDAYHTIWAYDKNLNLLWKTKNPGGYLLAHRIGTFDLDEDGKDEILAGATILNGDGQVINHLKTNSVKLWYGGHIDGIVPIQQNGVWYISVTYCDGLGFALFDAQGNLEWEMTGDHFEYLVGGYFFNTPELKDQFQLISKVHYKDGDPQVMVNQDGRLLGIMEPSSTVFSVDWTGDGYHEMVFYSPADIYSGTEKIADLFIPGNEKGHSFTVRVADVIGRNSLKTDGIPDIAARVIDEFKDHYLYIYTNRQGKMPTNYVYPGIGWESSANYFTKYYEYQR